MTRPHLDSEEPSCQRAPAWTVLLLAGLCAGAAALLAAAAIPAPPRRAGQDESAAIAEEDSSAAGEGGVIEEGVIEEGASEEGLIEEGVIEEGVIEEGAEPEGIPGVVGLSDGAHLRGAVSFGRGRSLRVYDLRTRRTYSLDLARIASIQTIVEMERQEEAWAFEEEGFRRKVKLGWTYPLRHYRQELQLRGGQMIEGHCHAAVFYIDDGRRERKLILPRTQRGDEGQTLDDLVYPRTIHLGGEPSGRTVVGKPEPSAFGEIAGEAKGLSAVAAIEIDTARGYRGGVRPSGEFRIEGLLPGKHAVFARAGDEIAAGWPPEVDLSEAQSASLERRIAALAEFFEERRILLRGGSARRLWLLVELRRRGETTLSGAGGGTAGVLRWELWVATPVGDGWEIDHRVFLDREVLPSGRKYREVRCCRDQPLWEIDVKPGKNPLPLFTTGRSSSDSPGRS